MSKYAINSRLYVEESKMDWSELKGLLDRLEDTRRPAEVTDAIRKAKREAHFDGGFCAYIKMVVLKDAGVQPKLNVVPPTKRVLLDPFFDLAYECALKGAFNHRDDPEMFMAYCSPFSDKRGKYLDEMTGPQRKVIAMMNEDMLAMKKKERQQLEPNTIEDALNNTIRKTVSETGKDTA